MKTALGCGFSGWLGPPQYPVFRIPKQFLIEFITASRADTPRIFGVSASTIKRYLRVRRRTGDVRPKPIPVPPARKRAILEEELPVQVHLNPDLTLQELCELLGETRGVEVSTATMRRTLKRLGLPLKKDLRLLRAR